MYAAWLCSTFAIQLANGQTCKEFSVCAFRLRLAPLDLVLETGWLLRSSLRAKIEATKKGGVDDIASAFGRLVVRTLRI